MKLAPMRYKDYTWPHNPETYSIRFQRSVAVHKIPGGRYAMQDMGLTYRVMEGEGTFSGTGAYEEFRKLASVFYAGGAGELVHPVWQSTRAYFVSLTLTQQPTPDYVRYRFVFWEAEPETESAGAQRTSAGDYTVRQGDTLWAIAARCGVTLAALLRANPQIEDPNRIVPGERVKLA